MSPIAPTGKSIGTASVTHHLTIVLSCKDKDNIANTKSDG